MKMTKDAGRAVAMFLVGALASVAMGNEVGAPTFTTLDNGFVYQTAGDVEPGVWSSQYQAVMERAVADGIPVIVFFGKPSCSRCSRLETELAIKTEEEWNVHEQFGDWPNFPEWIRQRNCLLLYGRLGEGDSSKVLALIQKGTALPQVSVWWDKDGDGVSEIDTRNVTWSGSGTQYASVLMKNVDRLILADASLNVTESEGGSSSGEVSSGGDKCESGDVDVVPDVGDSLTAEAGNRGSVEWTLSDWRDGVAIEGVSPSPQGVLAIPSEIGGKTVRSIADDAFAGCDRLTEVTIPDCVVRIGDNAFDGCESLQRVVIGQKVACIGADAFDGCDSLYDTVTIPGVKLVDGWAVGHTDSYPDTISLANVRGIAACAFEDCETLAAVAIPDSVTSIGECAFDGCESLRSVTIGNGVTHIGIDAFSECESLFDTTNMPGLKLVDGWVVGYTDECPAKPNLSSVRGIADGAFEWCDALVDVVMPDAATLIGECTFAGCDSLSKIDIGTNVTIIGANAFEFCTSLSGVSIPNSATVIADGAFAGCNIGIVKIPPGVVSIGYDAFDYCGVIANWDDYYSGGDITLWDETHGPTIVVAPSTLKNQMQMHDEYNEQLAIYFYDTPYNIIYDWKYVMNSDGGVTICGVEGSAPFGEVVIPSEIDGKAVTRIAPYAFSSRDGSEWSRYCTVTSFKIPESVTSIGANAFSGTSARETAMTTAMIGTGGVFGLSNCAPSQNVGTSSSVGGCSSQCNMVDGCATSGYAISNSAIGNNTITSMTISDNTSIDSFLLADGKVFDMAIRIVNASEEAVTITLPTGYIYETMKGANPLLIPAKSTNILTVTRTAERVFLVAREELSAIQ